MAKYDTAFRHVIAAEGGFVLSNDPADRGGQTFAGIARRYWPRWEGWQAIDAGAPVDEKLVYEFYRVEFWEKIRGDALISQAVATALFSFAVNAGVDQAIKLAQRAASVKDDGKIGPVTLYAFNATEPPLFLAKFALAKIAFYRDLCLKDASQRQFIIGWISRALKESAC